jgi:hypothetical protein
MYNTWGLIAQDNSDYVKGQIVVEGTNRLCLYQNLSATGFQVSYDDGETWLQAVPGDPSGEENKDPEEEEDPNALRLKCQTLEGPFLSSFRNAKIEREGVFAANCYITSINGYKRQKDGTFLSEDGKIVITLNINDDGTLASATKAWKGSSAADTYNYQYDRKGRLISAHVIDRYVVDGQVQILQEDKGTWTWDNADLITSFTKTYTPSNGQSQSQTQYFSYPTKLDNYFSVGKDYNPNRYMTENTNRQFPFVCGMNQLTDPFDCYGLTAALGLLGPGPAIIPYNGYYVLNPNNQHTIFYAKSTYDPGASGTMRGYKLISAECEEHNEYVDAGGGRYAIDERASYKKTLAEYGYEIKK